MKLSEKSWHAMLYKLVYGENDWLPNNLCPYFWKVILSMVVFIPLSIFCFPFRLVIITTNLIHRDYEKETPFEDGFFSWVFPVSLFTNACLFTVFSMVYMWFQNLIVIKGEIKPTVFQFFGCIGYVVLIGIGIHFLVRYIKEINHQKWLKTHMKEKYIAPEPEPNIFIEFIKAKYKRYCPKIEWDKK